MVLCARWGGPHQVPPLCGPSYCGGTVSDCALPAVKVLSQAAPHAPPVPNCCQFAARLVRVWFPEHYQGCRQATARLL